MSEPTRNQIYAALFSLISQGEGLPGVPGFILPGGQSLLWTSRRVRMWDNLPAKPALCQAEFTENYAPRRTNLPTKRFLGAEWWFFHAAGKDESAVPTILDNDIMDAVDAILAPPPSPDGIQRQTLGGLVFDCYIEGVVGKVAGDIEGDALISVPILIALP